MQGSNVVKLEEYLQFLVGKRQFHSHLEGPVMRNQEEIEQLCCYYIQF